MKSSIYSRVILTMLLATVMSAHATSGDGTRRPSTVAAEIEAAAAAGAPSGNPAGTPRGFTVSGPWVMNAIKLVLIGAACLAPREKILHLIGFEAVLGAATYAATLRGGNPTLAKEFAGRIGLASLIVLSCRLLKTPIEFAIPPIVYWLINEKAATAKLRELLAKAPEFSTYVGKKVLSENQLNAATTIFKWLFAGKPSES